MKTLGLVLGFIFVSTFAQADMFQDCEKGVWSKCLEIAIRYDWGLGLPQSHTKAAEFYTIACNHNDGQACSNLGVLYSNNKLGDFTWNQVVGLFEKACDLDYGTGCLNLGTTFKNLASGSIKADPNSPELLNMPVEESTAKALYFLKAGCDKKVGKACYSAAVMLSKQQKKMLEEKGDKVDEALVENLDKNIFSLLKTSCSLDYAPGCVSVGLYYYEGVGVEQSVVNSFQSIEKGCELKSAKGCRFLGNFYYYGISVEKDFQKTRDLYQKSCDLGDDEACEFLRKSKGSWGVYGDGAVYGGWTTGNGVWHL